MPASSNAPNGHGAALELVEQMPHHTAVSQKNKEAMVAVEGAGSDQIDLEDHEGKSASKSTHDDLRGMRRMGKGPTAGAHFSTNVNNVVRGPSNSYLGDRPLHHIACFGRRRKSGFSVVESLGMGWLRSDLSEHGTSLHTTCCLYRAAQC